jgi:ABC-type iron transport system FetAB permease component
MKLITLSRGTWLWHSRVCDNSNRRLWLYRMWILISVSATVLLNCTLSSERSERPERSLIWLCGLLLGNLKRTR